MDCAMITLREGDQLNWLPPAVEPGVGHLIEQTSALLDDISQQYRLTGQDPLDSPLYRATMQQLVELTRHHTHPRCEIVRTLHSDNKKPA